MSYKLKLINMTDYQAEIYYGYTTTNFGVGGISPNPPFVSVTSKETKKQLPLIVIKGHKECHIYHNHKKIKITIILKDDDNNTHKLSKHKVILNTKNIVSFNILGVDNLNTFPNNPVKKEEVVKELHRLQEYLPTLFTDNNWLTTGFGRIQLMSLPNKERMNEFYNLSKIAELILGLEQDLWNLVKEELLNIKDLPTKKLIFTIEPEHTWRKVIKIILRSQRVVLLPEQLTFMRLYSNKFVNLYNEVKMDVQNDIKVESTDEVNNDIEVEENTNDQIITTIHPSMFSRLRHGFYKKCSRFQQRIFGDQQTKLSNVKFGTEILTITCMRVYWRKLKIVSLEKKLHKKMKEYNLLFEEEQGYSQSSKNWQYLSAASSLITLGLLIPFGAPLGVATIAGTGLTSGAAAITTAIWGLSVTSSTVVTTAATGTTITVWTGVGLGGLAKTTCSILASKLAINYKHVYSKDKTFEFIKFNTQIHNKMLMEILTLEATIYLIEFPTKNGYSSLLGWMNDKRYTPRTSWSKKKNRLIWVKENSQIFEIAVPVGVTSKQSFVIMANG